MMKKPIKATKQLATAHLLKCSLNKKWPSTNEKRGCNVAITVEFATDCSSEIQTIKHSILLEITLIIALIPTLLRERE